MDTACLHRAWTAQPRRRPGESPMWIAQTTDVEALVRLSLAAGEAHITFSLIWRKAAPDRPRWIMRVLWKAPPAASLKWSPKPPSVGTRNSWIRVAISRSMTPPKCKAECLAASANRSKCADPQPSTLNCPERLVLGRNSHLALDRPLAQKGLAPAASPPALASDGTGRSAGPSQNTSAPSLSNSASSASPR